MNKINLNITFLCIFFPFGMLGQNFIEINGFPFNGVYEGVLDFADLDNDGDNDLFIAGTNSDHENRTNIFLNDGSGNFSELTSVIIESFANGGVAFADLNGDDTKDFVIVGGDGSGEIFAKLYLNDGMLNFTEIIDPDLRGVTSGTVALTDIDNDLDQDMIIVGRDASSEKKITLYTNDGTGNFTKKSSVFDSLDGVFNPEVKFFDANGNGANDVLIVGSGFSVTNIKLFFNDGEGNFTETVNSPFGQFALPNFDFADVDNDSDMDVLMTGSQVNGAGAKLYINSGDGIFIERLDVPFVGSSIGTVDFSDLDNDGDKDVILTGDPDGDEGYYTEIYLNDGFGFFEEYVDNSLVAVRFSSLALSDINSDGYEDVILGGWTQDGTVVTKLYSNNLVAKNVNLVKMNKNLFVFPNPCGIEKINFEYISNSDSDVVLDLFNNQGQLVYNSTSDLILGINHFEIDNRNLPKGIYFLRVNDGFRVSGAKIILN